MTLSLAEEIKAATKPHHTALNQRLLRVLPLALPPNTSNPHLYSYGIAHFFPVYSAFESSINALLLSQPSLSPVLSRLHISDLERSSRLQRDLIRLLPPSCLQTLSLFDNRKTKLDTHGKGDGSSMLSHEVTTFVTHIHESISVKPHLYLSYTWVFYMAIFSGGRYIRAKLQSAGADFWANTLPAESDESKYNRRDVEVKEQEEWPLSFWNFSGSSDGEDLKVDYKSRVGEMERILTLEDREEIINEAVEIMKRLLEIVRGIEVAVAEGVAEGHKTDSYESLSNISAAGNPSLSTLLWGSSKVSVTVPVKSGRA